MDTKECNWKVSSIVNIYMVSNPYFVNFLISLKNKPDILRRFQAVENCLYMIIPIIIIDCCNNS